MYMLRRKNVYVSFQRTGTFKWTIQGESLIAGQNLFNNVHVRLYM